MMKKLVLLSILLAMVVIVLGAYARLTDAGLGCPDWPGCYGHLSFSKTAENIETAQQAFPERPVEEHKAWNKHKLEDCFVRKRKLRDSGNGNATADQTRQSKRLQQARSLAAILQDADIEMAYGVTDDEEDSQE